MSLNRSVAFRSRVRPVRRWAAGAAALVLTFSLAAPVQAAPVGPDGGVLSPLWSAVQSWLDGLFRVTPDPPADDGPVPRALPGSCEMDPNGSTCEEAEAQGPIPPEPDVPPDPASG